MNLAQIECLSFALGLSLTLYLSLDLALALALALARSQSMSVLPVLGSMPTPDWPPGPGPVAGTPEEGKLPGRIAEKEKKFSQMLKRKRTNSAKS